MSFSNNLQNILEHYNLTAANAAYRCGITTEEFAGYLNGHYEADPRVLETMSNKFNVSVKELCGDDLEFTSFGNDFRRLREKSGLSRDEVSEVTGISMSVISTLERGITRSITKGTYAKLKDLFGNDIEVIAKRYGMKPMDKSEKVIVPPASEEQAQTGKAMWAQIAAGMTKKKMTQANLAKQLDVSTTTLGRIRRDGYIPTDAFKGKIAEVLGVDLSGQPDAQPVVKVAQPVVKVAEKPKREFQKDWVDLLGYIDSDSEFRKATVALFKYVFDGGELAAIEDAPQANMIMKMIGGKR